MFPCTTRHLATSSLIFLTPSSKRDTEALNSNLMKGFSLSMASSPLTRNPRTRWIISRREVRWESCGVSTTQYILLLSLLTTDLPTLTSGTSGIFYVQMILKDCRLITTMHFIWQHGTLRGLSRFRSHLESPTSISIVHSVQYFPNPRTCMIPCMIGCLSTPIPPILETPVCMFCIDAALMPKISSLWGCMDSECVPYVIWDDLPSLQ